MARVRLLGAEFVTSAVRADDLPQSPLPELAFAGRSNVGKSSLINVLAGRTLARTSAAPGKTRLANYYALKPEKGRAFHLVDLPGYGYARGAPDGRVFDTLAQEYFFGGLGTQRPVRGAIAGVLLLVDARHPGLDADRRAYAWFTAQEPPVCLIATKVDKLSKNERQRSARALAEMFGQAALLTSATTGDGIEELWTWIVQHLQQWTPQPR
jgi:GTP-binding protein